MIPVKIEVVYTRDIINPRIIRRLFRVSAEWEFYDTFGCIDKIYTLQGFKKLSEKFDTITVICNNPYYEIEVRPDCRYKYVLYETIESLTNTIKQYCTNVITKCVKISCTRCHCNYNILFNKVEDIDTNSLPLGWVRVDRRVLCDTCAIKYEELVNKFIHDYSEETKE